MNNQFPYFNPFYQIPQPNYNPNDYNKLEERINSLEKNIRILENKVNNLEKNNSFNNSHHYDEKNDMYMI